jgi:hypothetical protein
MVSGRRSLDGGDPLTIPIDYCAEGSNFNATPLMQ